MAPQLHILARQPLPGRCKTRLQTHCSTSQAAVIAAVLLEETVAIACQHWPGSVFLHGSPNRDHPLFAALSEQYSLHLLDQKGADLGQIQASALSVSLATGAAAAVIGCDLPDLEPALLPQVCLRLRHGENLLGLSPDGGYYLLGLQTVPKGLLHNIHWGSSEVATQLLGNAAHNNLPIACDLPHINDVDTWEDLLEAVAANPRFARRLHHHIPELKLESSSCHKP